jgi:hypothetical protein
MAEECHQSASEVRSALRQRHPALHRRVATTLLDGCEIQVRALNHLELATSPTRGSLRAPHAPVYLQNIYLTAGTCGRANAGIDGKQFRHRRLRDLFALPPCREALPDDRLRGPGRNRAHLFRASS